MGTATHETKSEAGSASRSSHEHRWDSRFDSCRSSSGVKESSLMMDEGKIMAGLEGLCIAIVQKFHRHYQALDREELLDEARLVAFQAVRSYRPGPRSLSSYVYRMVQWHFHASARNKSWLCCMGGNPGCHRDPFIHPGRLDTEAWLKEHELSGRAATAVRVVLAREGQGGKRALVRLLRQELGWTAQVVAEVWDEVWQALRG